MKIVAFFLWGLLRGTHASLLQALHFQASMKNLYKVHRKESKAQFNHVRLFGFCRELRF